MLAHARHSPLQFATNPNGTSARFSIDFRHGCGVATTAPDATDFV
jgi:hypothetical protein